MRERTEPSASSQQSLPHPQCVPAPCQLRRDSPPAADTGPCSSCRGDDNLSSRRDRFLELFRCQGNLSSLPQHPPMADGALCSRCPLPALNLPPEPWALSQLAPLASRRASAGKPDLVCCAFPLPCRPGEAVDGWLRPWWRVATERKQLSLG